MSSTRKKTQSARPLPRASRLRDRKADTRRSPSTIGQTDLCRCPRQLQVRLPQYLPESKVVAASASAGADSMCAWISRE